jgi:polysaccharide deacetylase family protein (PEP-CTERM system associated)
MRALTIDLEDWFQVYNFNKIIKYEDWHKQEHRIVNNTHKLLDILDRNNTKATFFVLGWTAGKFPELVKKIYEKGHEIACHGYCHKPVFLMNKEEFSKDIDNAIKAIKKACKVKPIGYRAPSFSIVKKTLWALDILREKGFKYDSSMVPVKHPDYGIRGIPNKPFNIRGMLEMPISTTYGLPVGGGYFRVYPYWLTKHLLRMNRHAVFYIHPWEFDSGMPRYNLPLQKRFRHYINLSTTEKKFNRLLRHFKFNKIEEII